MLRPIDLYFLQKEEPVKSCLQFLREFILAKNKDISENMSYGMPFFYYKGKRFCYLWIHKKARQPYIGFVHGSELHHEDLVQEDRAKMKILLLNAGNNIPVKKIDQLLNMAIAVVSK